MNQRGAVGVESDASQRKPEDKEKEEEEGEKEGRSGCWITGGWESKLINFMSTRIDAEIPGKASMGNLHIPGGGEHIINSKTQR